MIRNYGKAPYQVVVVHGGPGGLGAAAGIARGLEKEFGVVEPIQSKYSIEELIEELKEQIEEACSSPVILIGHSWGAWLVGLTAERYPELVSKVILVGSGPLTKEYAPFIGERRKANMSVEEQQEFEELIKLLEEPETEEKNRKLSRLGELVNQADYYEKLNLQTEQEDSLPSDGTMYSSIWPEAAQLRETGELLQHFQKLRCPVIVIQGEKDPHPLEGILEPLKNTDVIHHHYLLDKCGHTPWKEKYAADRFFQLLANELK